MAWVDTAGRVPLVRRRSGAFEIEYAAGYLLKRDLARLPQGSPQRVESARKTFEKFGLHRALRLAGAREGDRVRLGGVEFRLWDYPEPRLRPSEAGDGIAGYEYIVAPPVGRLDSAAVAVVADGIAAAVIARLLTS